LVPAQEDDVAIWNPQTYLEFADERSRPFFDLVGAVAAEAPGTVVDLGCGPGQLTAHLALRWPTAHIVGIDISPEMIGEARKHATDHVRFEIRDAASWVSSEPVDVIVSNATLQWVPGHRDLFARWVDSLAPGGWFAFQVPGNFEEPSHTLLAGLAADPRFAAATADVERPSAEDASTYLADLSALGCQVDAWVTTYLHVLTGDDPVLRWVSGTGARPVLRALSDEQRHVFEREYAALLRYAYPPQPYGTVLPFRRVFVVARKAGGS